MGRNSFFKRQKNDKKKHSRIENNRNKIIEHLTDYDFTINSAGTITGINIINPISTIVFPAVVGTTSVTNLTEKWFGNNNKTKIINIDASNLPNLGNGVFRDFPNLTNITLSDKLTVLSQDLFNGCSSLLNISIPDSVRIINNSVYLCYLLIHCLIVNQISFTVSYKIVIVIVFYNY